jgi:hypothetical protein
MYLVKAASVILIYAPHGVLCGKRTIYTKDGSFFDHNPYKEVITNSDKEYHDVQVRTPQQVAEGHSNIPEAAYHYIIEDNRFIIFNRGNGKRCFALVNYSSYYNSLLA